MSSTTFLNDFYSSDIMNHCEFLKYMMNLGKDDALLLATTMEQLEKGESAGKLSHNIEPFYSNHQNLPKNPLHILQSYVAIKELNQHNWNIYECVFLDCEKVWMLMVAFFTFTFQIMLFVVLVVYNVDHERFNSINEAEPVVYVMAIGTTFFFAKSCQDEIKEARGFRRAFKTLGVEHDVTSVRGVMQIVNFLVNVCMSLLVPLFNAYFILLSEDPNEAILNSVALFFLLELDEMVAPDWSDNRIRDELAINAHDYCMIPLTSSELQVRKIVSQGATKEVDYSEKAKNNAGENGYVKLMRGESVDNAVGHQYNDGDKLYVQLERGSSVNIHQRLNVTTYKTIRYEISGTRADEFFSAVNKFECLTNFRDLHD